MSRHGEILNLLNIINGKVDLILHALGTGTDFSKEDAQVLAATKQSAEATANVDAARAKIPPPKTTNQEGK